MWLLGASCRVVSHLIGGYLMLPEAHHGGFHMTEWPWWPGPMHIAYPLLFLGGVIVVTVLLWRKS